MSAPLVSIVIPTYNQARFLGAALDSVCAQTVSEWEAIVVNNFSDDDTEAVVKGYAHDPRIKLVNFKNNGVIAASRNEGIRRASGRYVAFLDSDDLWLPEKLQRSLDALEEGCDLVCHGQILVNDQGLHKPAGPSEARRITHEELLYKGSVIATSTVVVRREPLIQFGGFSEDPLLVTAEDYDLWIRLAQAGYRLHYIPDRLIHYRLHENNASKNVQRNARANVAILNRYFAAEGIRPGRWLRRLRRYGEIGSWVVRAWLAK